MKDKELRKSLYEGGLLRFNPSLNLGCELKREAHPSRMDEQDKKIYEMRRKIDALMILLNIEETKHKVRGLKKGNKEIEY
ncbi:MAG: hypothetical protein OEX12_05780 [Gammaproteobacteria bacterium]|nr:hypothetical protein [Gammaproteobacteria bacterium]